MGGPHVALVVETSGAYTRGLLRGVARYARVRGWRVTLVEHQPGSAPTAWFARGTWDGAIARIDNRRMAAAIRATGKPAVDMSDARLLPNPPFVKTDDAAVARTALAHFRDRGLNRLAYCGDSRFKWSAARLGHFRAVAADAGLPVREFVFAGWGRASEARLAKWLAALPHPVGVFACNDSRGREVLDACRLGDVHVPDQVAVLGVDNDDLLCDLADPPLSSVLPDTDRIGWTAAELLDTLMSGGNVATTAHYVPPVGVVTRRSSDVLAVPDEEVAAALRFIRAKACDGANVADVLKEVSVSRRFLEVRFVSLLGRTPLQEILRVRLERARALLTGTDLALDVVAARAGFRDAGYMSRIFKAKMGMTPGRCRELYRGQPITDG